MHTLGLCGRGFCLPPLKRKEHNQGPRPAGEQEARERASCWYKLSRAWTPGDPAAWPRPHSLARSLVFAHLILPALTLAYEDFPLLAWHSRLLHKPPLSSLLHLPPVPPVDDGPVPAQSTISRQGSELPPWPLCLASMSPPCLASSALTPTHTISSSVLPLWGWALARPLWTSQVPPPSHSAALECPFLFRPSRSQHGVQSACSTSGG